MGDHSTGVSWVDKALNSIKAGVAFIGGLAVTLAALPDVTPFVPAQYRPEVAVALSVITAIAVWWTKNKPLPVPPPAPVVEPPAQG